MKKPAAKWAVKNDGLNNPFLGYGGSRDKVGAGRYCLERIPDPELLALYYSSDIAAKFVDKLPEDAMRKGWFAHSDSAQETLTPLVQALERTHKLSSKIFEAWVRGRLWGGALLLIGANDGGLSEDPLDVSRVRSIDFLTVEDRRKISIESRYSDPLHPDYNEPELYRITSATNTAFVHATRVIRFDGVEVFGSDNEAGTNGWSLSVLQRAYETIKMFDTAFKSSGQLLSDAGQGVWKINGLADMIASSMNQLTARLAIADMSKSSGRGIMLDAENEDYTRIGTPLSGIPETLDRQMMRAASAGEMPVTILMGRSPGGMNATGESDLTNWYDAVASKQENVLKPRLLRLLEVATAGNIKDLEIEFTPLWNPSSKEIAETKKLEADTDAIYLQNGVLQPEEVALARFGDGDGNFQVDVSKPSRASAKVEQLAELESDT